MIRAFELGIGILSIAYFRFFPRHWARSLVFLVLFGLTGLDVVTRLALGLALPFRFTVWSGILLALMGLDEFGRPLLPEEP